MTISRKARLTSFLASLLLVFATKAQAYEITADSAMRQRMLLRASETADLILVGTVLDTSYVEETEIRTEYTVRVERIIKGPDTTLAAVSFTEFGGTIASVGADGIVEWRGSHRFPSYKYDIGGTYLFLLTRCDDDIRYRITCPSCTARLEGDSAMVNNPHVTESASALIDSVLTFAAASNLVQRKSSSDLIVVVRVETVVEESDLPHPDLTAAAVNAAVSDIVWRRPDAPRAPHGSFSIRIRSPLRADKTASGTRPVILADNEYLVFLRWSEDGWEMGNSIYSAWRRDGNSAVVEAYPCGRPHAIASRPWTDLIADVR